MRKRKGKKERMINKIRREVKRKRRRENEWKVQKKKPLREGKPQNERKGK